MAENCNKSASYVTEFYRKRSYAEKIREIILVAENCNINGPCIIEFYRRLQQKIIIEPLIYG